MASHIPSIGALRALRAHAELRPLTYQTCSCLPPRAHRLLHLASATMKSRAPRRHLSYAAPVTAVHAAPRVSPAFQELHGALAALETAGESYASLSQLRLALHGLESEDAGVRVSVLGLRGNMLARRLVRALLADPLAERQKWEDVLLEQDRRALMIRYGEQFRVDDRNPLLRTLSVPVEMLRRHRLELLVHHTNIALGTGEGIDGVSPLLRVELGTRAAGSRPEALYQAHKTVLVGNGLKEAETLFKMLASASEEGAELVHAGLSISSPDPASASVPGESRVALINVAEAESAIQVFRDSIENSFKYEHGWFASNVDTLGTFLTSGTASSAEGALKPALKAHISLVLRGTATTIAQEESERMEMLSAAQLSLETETGLRDALDTWSEFAHTELRDALENAKRSAAWRKLRWWALPWRVDDVGLLANDVLQRAYLVSAERHLLWIAGYFRAHDINLADHDIRRGSNKAISRKLEPNRRWFDALPKGNQLRDMYLEDEVLGKSSRATSGNEGTAADVLAAGEEDTIVVPQRLSDLNPWPQQIARSRAQLQADIWPLQATAQRVLVKAFSGTGLAGALGALAWVGELMGAYGSGSIVALGLVVVLRRVQSEWEMARAKWMDGVRLEGKEVLERVMRRGKEVLDKAVRNGEETLQRGGDGAREREVARELVRRASEALTRL